MPPVLPLAIPTGHVLRYGSFTFPVTTKTIGVDIHPVPDTSGRTTKWGEFSLTVEFVLAGAATDAYVLAIIEQLTKYGQPLLYRGRGIPVVINVGPSRDVNWGPKPEIVSLKPLSGPGIACKVLWRVTGCLPTCRDGVTAGWPAEFTYRMRYSIDASGLTTRAYSGRITIPGTRPPGDERVMPDSADYWREKIVPIVPLRFRRTSSDFDLDETKLTCTFSITDTQHPGRSLPPAGVVKASFNHSVSCPPGKFYTWDVACSGTYELGLNTRPSVAIREFFRLVKERKDYMLRELAKAPPRKDGKKSSAAVVPVQFSVTEPDVYGLPVVQLMLRFRVVDANLEEMLGASGLWWPDTGSDARAWRTSMEEITGPRGTAGLVFTVGDDYLVDLCQKTSPRLPPEPKEVDVELFQVDPKKLMTRVFTQPKPYESWLRYNNKTSVEIRSNNTPIITMPRKPITSAQDIYDAAVAATTGTAQGSAWNVGSPILPKVPSPFSLNDGKSIDTRQYGRVDVQRRGRALTFVVMEGSAMRVGYPVPRPDLIEVGGVKPVPMNRDGVEFFEHEMIGNMGFPVYAAKWRFRYLVPDADGSKAAIGPIEVLPNPLEGTGEAAV